LEVDEGAAVIAIAPGTLVVDAIADIARPAAMVMINLWDRWVECCWELECLVLTQDSESLLPRGREMLDKEYVEVDFAEHECFEHVVTYIKKEVAGTQEWQDRSLPRTIHP
jgi:hypothetical protein